MFTQDFLSGEMKYFQFGMWSISKSRLHEAPLNETHCGCYLIPVILTEMKFHLGFQMLCKRSPKMKSSERKHLHMLIFHKRKNSRSKDQNKSLYCSISTAMKTYVNRTFFQVESMFHFGSHVKNLLLI